jgi:hypothetical protein
MNTNHPPLSELTLSRVLRQTSTPAFTLTLTKEAQRPRYRIHVTWRYAPERTSPLAMSDDQADAEAIFQAMVASYALLPLSLT